MIGRWRNWNRDMAPYGLSDTYRLGAEWLDGCDMVEDWGCGRGWLTTHIPADRYRGIDGTRGPHTSVVADLTEYRSFVEGVFIRHVLEHNPGWERILANAAMSFTERMVVILFTPYATGDVAEQIGWSDILGVPDLALPEPRIRELLDGLIFTAETIDTDTQYGVEHIWRVAR